MRKSVITVEHKVLDVEKVWLTRKEAAKYLGVSVDFVKQLCLGMRLPWYKVCASNGTKGGKRCGRDGICFIKKSDLDKLVKSNKICE